ncbi:F-box protein GID2-like [Musa acuminata AAA Group]|uniref:F-box protein GID2 n=1 Tax=Musa acuminata subsp. malaccensis TaxID=214687 RepID=A0A804KMR7_MUSAM|nr:PREDICTED: F-box protein GID2-like [Musa acuminata subsp. malaccensis]CAG1836205.1 unnamed protein product [Musa acuminata subsp. malaccensis]
MKRRSIDGKEEKKNKRPRSAEVAAPEEAVSAAELGEDLLLEVLKRADARTLGRAACVSRGWRRLAEDERLWEAVCTRDWVKVPCGKQQLRAVVLALGGFRRLHSLYILPFLAPSAALPSPMTGRPHPQQRWGKDEVQLSLSLLSIGFFEKMIPNNNRGGRGGA